MQPSRATGQRKSLAVATIFIGICLGLGACELLTRSFAHLRAHFNRVTVVYWDTRQGADCYPREEGTELPIDLDKEEGRAAFQRALPYLRNLYPISQGPEASLNEMVENISATRAVPLLRPVTPLCVLFNSQPDSPRYIVSPDHFKDSIALLGDSFVYGQGVEESRTFTRQLSDLTGARIHSYASPGDNISEVMRQFQTALSEKSKFHFSRIIYVFVLNDPGMPPELKNQQNQIDDFMNIRWAAWREHESFIFRTLGDLSEYSMMAGLLLDRVLTAAVRRQTIQWYLDIFDSRTNPLLERTFDAISSMNNEAHKAGIDFQLVVYPLMVDMRHYPFDRIHDTIRELAAKRGIPTLDLLPAFKRDHNNHRLVVHSIDGHPNSFAQGIAARATAKYLNELKRR